MVPVTEGRPAGDALQEVAAGTWLVRLPIPYRELGTAYAYLLETGDGLLLIDAGHQDEEGWEVLVAAAQAVGPGLEGVVGILLTHLHADHCGPADRVRALSGAWVGAHPGELDYARQSRHAMSEAGLRDILRWCGAPPATHAYVIDAVTGRPPSGLPPSLDRALTAGEEVVVGTRRLQAVETPGHTSSHLVFHEPDAGLLFAGDLLLPRTTPNVGADPNLGDNPLAEFLDSLQRAAALEPALVLPGHEGVYADAAGRADALAAHHEARLREVAAISAGPPRSIWDITMAMKWSRPVEGEGFAAFAACGEATAHLLLLETRGLVERRHDDDGRVLWSAAA